jgi:N-methylhydantoinase B
MERFKLAPWGVQGGRAGTPGSCVVNRDTDRARDIGKVDVLRLEPGDVVSICSPAGGGFGDPRRRDPERVLADVRAGFLTAAQAREQYGVILVGGAGGKVDADATAAARAAMPAPEAPFDYGPGRRELERRWPPALQDAAVRLLATVPPAVRDWGKHRIYDRIQAIAAERAPTVADVEHAWVEIRGRLARALGAAPAP